ncbi:MAG: winged helix-turn-helix domain-containing protein [Prochloraceae cyanobacterium]
MKRFIQWIQQKWEIDCCRETVRKTLKQMGFSWKKAKKLLNKGNTAKRAEFLEKITGLLDDALHQNRLLIYIDEAHIHLDTDEGYGWSIEGERFWISSSSPPKKKSLFLRCLYL